MHDNPFESPQAITEPQPVTPAVGIENLPIASSNRRFFNLILDTFFFYIFLSVCLVNLVQMGFLSSFEGPLPLQIIAIGLFLLYFVPQEIIWGRTLAKFITGTRVVNHEGGPASPGQILGRTLARFIPFEVLSFHGYHPVGWHDRLSKTRVIQQR